MKEFFQNFIKKRAILALIITIIAIIESNHFWFIYKPMPVDLDIQGKGHCNVEIVLNKKDSKDTTKGKKENIDINLDKKSHISANIKKAKKTKKIIIILSDFIKDKQITIDNVNLSKGKLTLDMSKFSVEGANSSVENNKLLLKPTANIITLFYEDKLNIKAPHTFDIMLLIILAVLTYLLAYKLTDYIADFKTIKGKSRTDIIFLTIFFIFLFTPMSHVNTDDVSQKENRNLAKWRPIILKSGEFNFNFGNDFNNYFSDRFSNRDKFINTYYSILSLFSAYYYEDKSIIYNKKEDFAFNKSPSSTNILLKKDLFSDKELKIIRKNLTKLQNYCDKNNVKLYIMLSNDKESIYPEFYPSYYKSGNTQSRLEQLKDLLSTIPNLQVISPQENLLKSKKDNMVFMPYDTHLNGLGGYIEYDTIMSELKKSYKNIQPINYSDITIVKGIAKSDSIPPKRFITEEYTHLDIYKLKEKHSVLEQQADNTIKSFYYKRYSNKYVKNNLKVTIIGDSFHCRYLDLLSETFASVKSLFVGFGYDFDLDTDTKKKLFGEKPDILILETTERFLQRFLSFDSLFDVFETKYRTK